MVQVTQYTPLAAPGRVRTFLAKAKATVQITQYTALAAPGRVRIFLAKTAAPVVDATFGLSIFRRRRRF